MFAWPCFVALSHSHTARRRGFSYVHNCAAANTRNIDHDVTPVKELYKDELFAELLEEGAGVAEKRQRCAGRLEVLGKAMDVVTQIAGFRPSED
jgi:hypothetical protein